jgi:hypothetical protein
MALQPFEKEKSKQHGRQHQSMNDALVTILELINGFPAKDPENID